MARACRGFIVCTVAYTPKSRFRPPLRWWPRLVKIPWEWSVRCFQPIYCRLVISASPQDRLISSSSAITGRHRAILGLPLFLFPWDIHRSGRLWILLQWGWGEEWHAEVTSPPSWAGGTSRSPAWCPVARFLFLWKSSLVTLKGHKNRQFLRGHLVWKADILFVSSTVPLQHPKSV